MGVGEEDARASVESRRSKAFVDSSVSKILEFENELIECLQRLIGDLESLEVLVPEVERLKGLLSNETTINAFIAFGGVNLLIYFLTQHGSNSGLRTSICHVLVNVMKMNPSSISMIADLEGTEAIMDIMVADSERENLTECLEVLKCLAVTSRGQVVMCENGFSDIVAQILRKSQDSSLIQGCLETYALVAESSAKMRERTSAENVAAILWFLNNLKEGGYASPDRKSHYKLVLVLLGNLCVQNLSNQTALVEAKFVESTLASLAEKDFDKEILEEGCFALAKCISHHVEGAQAVLSAKDGLLTICEAIRNNKENDRVTEFCVDILTEVANFRSTSIECAYAPELFAAGSVNLMVELLDEGHGNTLKNIQFLGMVGLKTNVKEKMVEAGVVKTLVKVLDGRPVNSEIACPCLLAAGNLASSSSDVKQKIEEAGMLRAIEDLLLESVKLGEKALDVVIENALKVLAILVDGCQENQTKAGEGSLAKTVAETMDNKMDCWPVQEHGCNFLVKVTAYDQSISSKMIEIGVDKLAERIMSAHTGNVMVESGARALQELLQYERRGRDMTISGAVAQRRPSRTRQKPQESHYRGTSKGRRDKSVSPVRTRSGRRGTSVEPTTNRNSFLEGRRQRGRETATAFGLDTVQEHE